MTKGYNPQEQQHDTTELEPSHAGEDRSENYLHPCHAGNSDPPVSYMAYIIASRLLPMGAAMFNRRSDANCVLCVGEKRFYVHVQMLAVSTLLIFFASDANKPSLTDEER